MSKAYTVEEMQKMFLDQVEGIARYWSRLEGKTKAEAVEGALFSMLVIFDGEAGGFPACDLIPSPHPDNKQYSIDNGEDYFPEGENIADGSLHEQFLRD